MNRTHHNIDHISKCQLKKLFGIPPMCWPRNPTTSSVTPVKRRKKNPNSQLANCHGCQATDTNSRKQTRGSHWRGPWKRKALTRGRKKTGWWSLGWPPHMCGQQGGVCFFYSLSSGRMTASIFCRLCCARIKLFLICLWFVNTNIR